MIDTRSFRYVLAAAEHGSFRRAAASLNVQQSTISRAIGKLEARLGSQLFERSHAGISSTPVGDRFVKEAALGFAHLQGAMQAIHAVQVGENGQLKIGTTVPFTLISDAMEHFCEEFVGIDVELIETTNSEGSKSIRQRKMDIAFVTRPVLAETSQSLHLRDNCLFVALPKAHRLAKVRQLALSELRCERLLLGAVGLGPDVADYLAETVAEGQLAVRLHRVGQCDLINMVAKGLGVTLSIDPLPDFVREQVALIPLMGTQVIPIHAVWSDSNTNPALKAFLHVLQRPSRLTRMA